MSTQVGYGGGLGTGKASSSARTLKLVRQLHTYFGLFIAPALLFFAFTGAVQTLSLHESAGSSYQPPAWLARMGQLHKDQNIELRKPRPEIPQPAAKPRNDAGPGSSTATVAAAPASPPRPPVTLASKQRQHLPEKVFFLLVCAGLFSSVLTGIFMAYRYGRGKLLVTAWLLAGIVVPLLLLPF